MTSLADMCMQVELTGGSQKHPDTWQIHTLANYLDAKGKTVYICCLKPAGVSRTLMTQANKVPAWMQQATAPSTQQQQTISSPSLLS